MLSRVITIACSARYMLSPFRLSSVTRIIEQETKLRLG